MAAAVEAIARNPSATTDIRGSLLLGLVLIESLVIYVLLISLILLFPLPVREVARRTTRSAGVKACLANERSFASSIQTPRRPSRAVAVSFFPCGAGLRLLRLSPPCDSASHGSTPWLLLMAFFWGSNFSVVKAALRELPGPAFNAIRLTIASALFLGIIAWREGLGASLRRVTRGDWWRLAGLAVLGHFIYQILFLGGVARTSVANSALIFGCTPITVSLIGAWLGHERPGWLRWTGTVISLAGIYFVVGHGARAGDLFVDRRRPHLHRDAQLGGLHRRHAPDARSLLADIRDRPDDGDG